MKVNSKKVEKNKHDAELLELAEIFVGTALLTADDIFGLTPEQSDAFCSAYAEVINGYGENRRGAAEKVKRELEERGIGVKLR